MKLLLFAALLSGCTDYHIGDCVQFDSFKESSPKTKHIILGPSEDSSGLLLGQYDDIPGNCIYGYTWPMTNLALQLRFSKVECGNKPTTVIDYKFLQQEELLTLLNIVAVLPKQCTFTEAE